MKTVRWIKAPVDKEGGGRVAKVFHQREGRAGIVMFVITRRAKSLLLPPLLARGGVQPPRKLKKYYSVPFPISPLTAGSLSGESPLTNKILSLPETGT